MFYIPHSWLLCAVSLLPGILTPGHSTFCSIFSQGICTFRHYFHLLSHKLSIYLALACSHPPFHKAVHTRTVTVAGGRRLRLGSLRMQHSPGSCKGT